mmetsp:Transcript_775/g.1922  ORF Transcript_775/g.1922 Transcript_775/m.1922 type:complete len:634 (-) Transcript_775:85-1986(-)
MESRRHPSAVLTLATAAVTVLVASAEPARCPGSVNVQGYGDVQMVPTGWEKISVKDGALVAQMGGRTYFAEQCTAGKFDNTQYLALDLLGKTLRYTTDMSGAGCGCNAALYLVAMRQNSIVGSCNDYYCDANSVCDVSCAEIDIQEANIHAWHSTLHGAQDHSGVGAGLGGGDSWTGPRDWTEDEYGPGAKCVDTSRPFEVAVSFPTNSEGVLSAMEVELSQRDSPCPLSVTIGNYKGMSELSKALAAGMTPVASYWSNNRMLWLDGEGADKKGPCMVDHASQCADTVMFYDFKVADIEHEEEQLRAEVDQPEAATEPAATTAQVTTWWQPWTWPGPWQQKESAAETTTTHATKTPSAKLPTMDAAKALLVSAFPIEKVHSPANDVCSKYLDTVGCDWTKNHNCPGQPPGRIGQALDDGTPGFACCCEFGLWKEANIDDEHLEVRVCTASHGATLGGDACCGQDAFVNHLQDICPPETPTCIGYVKDKRWGTCHVAQPWQQCGGRKNSKPWWGPTACTPGYTCKVVTEDYSQCSNMGAAQAPDEHVIMAKDAEIADRSLSDRLPRVAQCAAALFAIVGIAFFAVSHRCTSLARIFQTRRENDTRRALAIDTTMSHEMSVQGALLALDDEMLAV